jgi:hypothetical protein
MNDYLSRATGTAHQHIAAALHQGKGTKMTTPEGCHRGKQGSRNARNSNAAHSARRGGDQDEQYGRGEETMPRHALKV